jgi:hypothetical protein
VTAPTWLLSAIPRSGSSLCCRLAGELPDTVALSEPMSLLEFDGLSEVAEAVSHIESFAADSRVRIREQGVARSVHVSGQLDDSRVEARADASGLRLPQGEQGEIRITKPLTENYQLLIKHNALFAALMPQLSQRFDCLALVRNPLAVLVSWQTVDLPVNRGQVPAGERYAPQLRERLALEPAVLQKQLLILDWFFTQYHKFLPAAKILKYETLVQSGGEALFAALGHPGASRPALENQNVSHRCTDESIRQLLSGLMSAQGQWCAFYSPRECEELADRLAPSP